MLAQCYGELPLGDFARFVPLAVQRLASLGGFLSGQCGSAWKRDPVSGVIGVG